MKLAIIKTLAAVAVVTMAVSAVQAQTYFTTFSLTAVKQGTVTNDGTTSVATVANLKIATKDILTALAQDLSLPPFPSGSRLALIYTNSGYQYEVMDKSNKVTDVSSVLQFVENYGSDIGQFKVLDSNHAGNQKYWYLCTITYAGTSSGLSFAINGLDLYSSSTSKPDKHGLQTIVELDAYSDFSGFGTATDGSHMFVSGTAADSSTRKQ